MVIAKHLRVVSKLTLSDCDLGSLAMRISIYIKHGVRPYYCPCVTPQGLV